MPPFQELLLRAKSTTTRARAVLGRTMEVSHPPRSEKEEEEEQKRLLLKGLSLSPLEEEEP